ncbi:SusC/RagA family TonB-linked outer membrane protein [Bacteroidia bacterium]|nr:SusC/RagA family TonB-linked outer membrane protein [Bacteroidia bacterium]
MKKLWSALTLSALFLFWGQTTAFGQETRLTLNLKNTTLENIFKEIEKQSEYIFFYNNAINLSKKKDITVVDKSINEVLSILLKGSDTKYSISDRQVTFYTEKTQPKPPAAAAVKQVSGIVTDGNGEVVIGATVMVKGTTTGTSTGINGDYDIQVPEGATLVFSFIGMETKTEAVGGRARIDVVMNTTATGIDDVVVVGFGTQKKASVVGAIQTINAKELQTPSSSLSNSFAGRLAGVISVQRSGEPGQDAASFWIRGISTFAGPTNPLIYIDGVEASAGDLNALSPEVIENFSILKDATATALYGARGANGVMLVTTRRGRDMEKAVIHIRIENSITQPTQTMQLADGVDYMVAYNDAIMNRNPVAVPRFSNEKIVNTLKGIDPIVFPNVDWQKTLFNNFASTQGASLNVTGGGKRVNYFLNATFNNDNGMLKKDPNNSFNNQMRQFRTSLQGNIEAFLTSTTKVNLRLNTQIVSYTGSAAGTASIYRDIFQTPPVLFQPYYENKTGEDHILFGNYPNGPVNYYPDPGSGYLNPYARMVSGYSEQFSSTNTASLSAEQDMKFLLDGLKVNALVSFKNYALTNGTRYYNPYYYNLSSYTQQPDGTYDYELTAMKRGNTALTSWFGSGGDRLINLQGSIEYAQQFGKHDVSGLLVYLQRDYSNNAPGSYLTSLPERNQGFAGRFTYAFDNRYLAEVNFGYNGSENFKKGNRMGFFPSAALGYIISNESYFEPLSKVVSQLKIRGSYGLVGNSSTNPRFPYLSEVTLGASGFAFGDNNQNAKYGAVISKYGTESAHWEKGTKINLGVDLTLLNALYVSVDMFREKRSDIFMQRNMVPAETGVPSDQKPYANLGVVQNQGMDITVEYNKAINKDLIVNLRGSFTYAQNKLLDRDEMPREFDYQSDIGKPLNVNRGLRAIGLFKDQDDIDNSPVQTYMAQNLFKPGDIKYADLNGDGKVDDNDMEQMGNPFIPQIIYGFGGSVSYKHFDFSIFMQGVAKTSIVMANIHPFTTSETVLFDFIAQDYWTEQNPNPNAAYPRLVNGTVNHNNFVTSSYWQRDGAFLRLKNLEIGYTYKFARIYIAGQNLLTFSKFKYFDPEIGGYEDTSDAGKARGNGLSYPTLRMYNIGVQLTF